MNFGYMLFRSSWLPKWGQSFGLWECYDLMGWSFIIWQVVDGFECFALFTYESVFTGGDFYDQEQVLSFQHALPRQVL